MNKIEALNEKALESAVIAHDKEEAAMRGEPDPWADERPEDEFADRKAAMAEAIRAYLAASDAEREPVSAAETTADTLQRFPKIMGALAKAEREPIIHAEFETVVGGLTGTTSAPIKRVERQDDGSLTVVIDHWPTPTVRALEAENARLRELPRDLVTILRTEAKNQRTPPIDYVVAEDGGRMVHRPDPDIAMAELLEEAATAIAAKDAEVERLRELASELPIVKYALRATEARLVEALKALEPFAALADIFDHHAGNRPKEGVIAQWSDHRVGDRDIKVEHLRAARRVREGGKVDVL